MSMKTVINEHTRIAMSVVISIAMLAFWLGTVASKASQNSDAVHEIKATQENFQEDVINRLSRIEGYLNNDSRSFGQRKHNFNK